MFRHQDWADIFLKMIPNKIANAAMRTVRIKTIQKVEQLK